MNEQAVAEFEARLSGELVRPGAAGYDETRAVWNTMIDRRPVLIARCTNAADVVAAVHFTREQELLASVRGGGHNVAGSAVCDGGLMIDLSPMKAVRVDPQARTARVQGGAVGADLDRATQAFGLATPSGVVSTTGVAGLTLGGGFGRLSRTCGLAADNLLSVNVVTADGKLITASKDEHADLFWGIRGGGGNFGIVTAFEFRLHEVGPTVLFGPIVYPAKDAPEVLRHYREFASGAPWECSVWLDILTAPPLPFLPEHVHGTKVLFVVPFYVGDINKGEAVLKPLRTYGDPIADAVAPTEYTAVQSAIDELYAPGMRNYWKSHNFIDLPEGALDALARCMETLPTPQSDILISHMGGAINDVAPDAIAYPHRATEFVVTPGARWESPADDERCIGWVRDCHEALAEHASGGTYVNFISERQGDERAAYGANYDRLRRLKNRYDPQNLFRMNQNIPPAGNRDA